MMLVDSYGADNSIMSILLLLLNISFAVKCFYGPLFVFMDHCLFLWTTVCFYGPLFVFMDQCLFLWTTVCFYGPLFVFMDHCLFLWTTVCFSFLILSCYLSFNSRLHQNVNDKYLSDICCVFNFNWLLYARSQWI
jgi:hypothetical protein